VKTLGLIGGMSWESTAVYYRLINELVRERLGGLHSAQLLMWSFDFEEVERCQAEDRWDEATEMMVGAARRLEAGGAGILVICTNTMHRMADEVEEATGLPLVHIADATAEAVRARGVGRVGLLGTAYTMEQDFYRGRLIDRHGLQVVIPEKADRRTVHDVIYDELCQGEVRRESRARYLEIVGRLRTHGAEGVILGCTEIGLLIGQNDLDIPVFDSTEVHAAAAVDAALAN
jgi:aspartate racemase